jgi:hypothetical protein
MFAVARRLRTIRPCYNVHRCSLTKIPLFVPLLYLCFRTLIDLVLNEAKLVQWELGVYITFLIKNIHIHTYIINAKVCLSISSKPVQVLKLWTDLDEIWYTDSMISGKDLRWFFTPYIIPENTISISMRTESRAEAIYIINAKVTRSVCLLTFHA